ncbi:tigger transposable element-derived protein 6-like, partial [Ixodes scapularis]
GYLEGYTPRDIFNADETALFFKLLPDKTITYKGENCGGGERSKKRVIVLVVANMTGTEKLTLLVIGKSMKPRCFKNIRTLPTDYEANRKAWMTGELFKKRLKKLDRKFELSNRQVLLIVDNCSAHKVDVELKAIKLMFLPPNTTAALQPMDQGVIKNIKSFYKQRAVDRSAPVDTARRAWGGDGPGGGAPCAPCHSRPPGWLQVGSLPPSPVTLGPEQLEKLKRELEVVQRNMTVFGEMLSELVPGQEQHSDWELLQELQKTCHAMQTRVVDLVDK